MKNRIQMILEEYRSNLDPQNKVRTLIVEPGKHPYVQEIGSDYKTLFLHFRRSHRGIHLRLGWCGYSL